MQGWDEGDAHVVLNSEDKFKKVPPKIKINNISKQYFKKQN